MNNKRQDLEGDSSTKPLELENEYIRLELLPHLGGKISKIISRQTGVNLLHLSDEMGDTKPPQYGDLYAPPFSCGFDECFPTVAPSTYRQNGSSIQLPDHGELWSRPWNVERNNGKLTLSANGVNLEYELLKEIKLDKNRVIISYTLKNTGQKSFKYLWSSHPLLEVDAGDEILLPDEVEQLVVYSSNKAELAEGSYRDWPKMDDDNNDFSEVLGKRSGFATKLFVENIPAGKAALFRKKNNESIVFEFNTNEIPHLGLWLCYGGWPGDAESPEYAIALEPTTASTDELSEAIDQNKADEINPGQEKSWSLSISIEQGKANI